MLLNIIESSSIVTLLLLGMSLTIAGLLKGTIGVGMPIVALPLLSMLIDVKGAVMLLSVPLILSNIPQAVEGGQTLDCLIRLLPVLLGMMPGLVIGVIMLLKVDPVTIKEVAGVVIMIVAILTMVAPKFRLRDNLKIPVGFAAGFMGGTLGGVAAMSGPLVFTFLVAKGLRGKDFIKEASLFLVISSALLAVFLSSSQSFDWRDIAVSTLALAPVALGMLLGQKLRDRIPAEAFKNLVLLTVLVSGAGLLAKALLS
jgi:uncharacterized membrane protein YfcA